MTEPSLLICAAEMSGDARGACLVREIRRAAPRLAVYGLGGARMREAGVDVRLDITDRGTVGWFDHWPDLPCYLSALRFWRHEVRRGRPSAAMVIDAPGIGFPFARLARAARVPVIYFVTPQTWLWNPDAAVERLRACADVVVPTLPAEAELYRRAGLQVVYEGHPALDDLLENYGDDAGRCFDEPGSPAAPRRARAARAPFTIALVPGSRRHTIRRLLPIMVDAIEAVGQSVRVGEVLVSVAAHALRDEVDACLRGGSSNLTVVEGDLASTLKSSDAVIASTGGNLLEAAFAGVPACACYRVDALTYLGARHVLRLHRRIAAYALPNLVTGEPVVPELIQHDATPERIARAVVRLLTDEGGRERIRDGYRRVRGALGSRGVNGRTAEKLIQLADLRCQARPLQRP